jgi:hypothetical protein
MRQHLIPLLWVLGFFSTDGIAVAYAESGKQQSTSVQKLSVLWPRLFFDIAERQQIEMQRQAVSGGEAIAVDQTAPNTDIVLPNVPLVTSLELQGISQTAKGRSAWLNGETVHSGDSYGGWRVEVEAHRIRLSASDQKEVVLRPGQKVDLIRSEVVDVVPKGSFGMKIQYPP